MSEYNCFELNIGLFVTGGQNDYATVANRAMRIDRTLNVLYGGSAVIRSKVVSAMYEAGGEVAGEPTLVVSLSGRFAAGALRGAVYALAEENEQDCIAVFEPETGRGVLVGPKAADWGEFNPDFFVRFYD